MTAYEAPTVTLLGRIVYRGEQDRSFTIESADGWLLGITERENGTFDAVLVGPIGGSPYASHLRATADEAIEKACDFLRDQLRQPAAAAAVRLLASLEVGAR